MSDCPVYTPDGQELVFYDALWTAANPSGVPELSGQVVVPFFLKSKVDKGILKQIWTFSCGQTLSMNKVQFYTALRFIVMVQNGEMPINKERLLATKTVKFEPPRFIDVPLQLPVAPAVNSSMPGGPAMPNAGPTPPAAAAAGSVGPPPYAITPDDHIRYHELFLKTDANNDGKVAGKEAVDLFRKSGLSQDVLKSIWAMADCDKDNFLSPKEFCVAFHLIVCVSKRGWPCPPTLPPPLLTFLANAPVQPSRGAQSPMPPQPPPEVTSQSPASVPVPTPVAAPPQVQQALPMTMPALAPTSVSISDAFGDVGGEKPMADVPLPSNLMAGTSSTAEAPLPPSLTVAPPTDVDSVEISKGVSDISSIAKKTLATQQESLDSSERIADSMKSLISKLKGDKISLSAAVEKAESDLDAIKVKQTSAISEIDALRQELSCLQEKLASVMNDTSSASVNLVELEAEKKSLKITLDQLKASIGSNSDESLSKATALGGLTASNAALGTQESMLKASLGKEMNDSAVLNTEISLLKELVGGLTQQSGDGSMKLEALEKQLVDAKQVNQSSTQRIRVIEADLTSLKDENYNLKEEKRELLNKLADASNVSISTTPLMKGLSSDSSGVTPLMNGQTRDYMASIATPDPIPASEVCPVPTEWPRQEEEEQPPKAAQYEAMVDDPLEDPFANISAPPASGSTAVIEPSSSAAATIDPFGSMADSNDPFAVASAPEVEASPASSSEDPFGSVGEAVPSAPPSIETPHTATTADDPFGSASTIVPSTDVDPFGSMGGDVDTDPFGAVSTGGDGGGFDAAFPASFDAPTDGGNLGGFDAEFPAFGDSSADPFASAADGAASNTNTNGDNDSFGAFPAF